MASATSLPSGFVATDWGRATAPPRMPDGAPSRSAQPRAELPPAREMAKAAALIDKAKQVLRAQFDALRDGQPIDLPAIRRLTRDVALSINRHRHAVIGLTRLRSSHEYTYIHSIAVSALMIGLARELGLPEEQVAAAGLAGMLHDIGKSKVPVSVLDKPGPLSSDEWVTIKTHPERGAAILRRLGEMDPIVLDVALHHHERLDGSGYPHALRADEISIHARIAAVCDVYDALTSRRAYKEARPAAAVLEVMTRAVGQFDPQVLRALRTLIGAFPAGTLVRLQRGQLAVVISEVPENPLSPRVELVGHAVSGRPIEAAICETAGNPIVAVERPEDWPHLDLSQSS
ncbi:HD domain-containing phosphohydrolase [Sphingomonas sp.]|uniref:HD domain-containing phosphohydrolase n=1 Tax=Sphingomonas sp. TaxID=28214 RepID=UPI003CC5BDB2